jgi:pimeloyl-ACP methyl ester carboxylesterase
VADVIITCYGDPALFQQARFATEVTELTRRDELGYAASVLIGSVRTLTAEFVRKGRHSAWRDAARVTAPTLVIYGSRDRLVDARMAGRAAHQFADARVVVRGKGIPGPFGPRKSLILGEDKCRCRRWSSQPPS